MPTSRSKAKPVSLSVLESPGELRRRTWVQMARTFTQMQRKVIVMLAKHDLTLPQFDVLATLRFSEGVTQQELAARLLVTKGNVCGVLDRLEATGWVQRKPDAEDGRTNRLHLTATGKRKIDAVLPKHDAMLESTLQVLSDVEVKALRKALEQLDDAPGED